MSDIVFSSSTDDEIVVINTGASEIEINAAKNATLTYRNEALAAKDAAVIAQGLAETAQGLAETAETTVTAKASDANNSAVSAQGYATTAYNYSLSAEASATTATEQALVSSNSATEASGFATNASNYATAAFDSKTNASTSEDNASDYMTTTLEARDETLVTRMAVNEKYALFHEAFCGAFLTVNLPTNKPAGTLAYDLTIFQLVAWNGGAWVGATKGDSVTDITSNKVGATTTVNMFIEGALVESFQIEDGSQGIQGIQGVQGVQGIQGIQGIQGDSITSVTSTKVGGTTTVKVYIASVLAYTFTIEDGQEAYSDAEIKTKYENNLDTNAFTDAEQSKLSGIEAGAEVNEVTLAGVETLTNKTIDGISNWIGANHIHYKIKATEAITAGNVLMGVGYNMGEDAFEVAKWTTVSGKPALGLSQTNLATGEFGMLVQAGQIKDINTSALSEGVIYYPANNGALTSTKPTTGQYQACVYVLRSHSSQGAVTVNFSEPIMIGSTSQEGYVQLNDTLTSTSTVQALTANQGKALKDSLTAITEW